MKKQNLLTTMLLLFALIAGSTSAWATLPTSPKWVATSFASIADNATVIIISNSNIANNIALPSVTSSSSGPARKECTVSTTDGVTTITPPSGTSLQDLAWTLKKTTNGVKFYQEGSDNIRLYITSATNTGVRVSNASSSNDEFVLGDSKHLLKATTLDRYVGPYEGGSDWRSYNSETATNYNGAVLTFYVLQAANDKATSVTIDASGITNTNVFTGTAAGSLSATVKDKNDAAIVGASVTWSSGTPSVATINASGVVTLVGEGTTTITASYAGVTGTYDPSTATFELTVTNSDPTNVNEFRKVTDASTLRAGDQLLLVYEAVAGNRALGAINSDGKYYTAASVTISEGVISDPTGVAVLTLGGEEGAWTIKSSLSGNYLSLTSSSNELRAAETVSENDTENWTITIGDYVMVINNKYPQDSKGNDRYIQWNSGSPRFACYGGTQQNLQLYRLSKSVTITDAEYATYCSSKALNFDGVGIKAFTATDSETKVTLNQITSGKVPANTPVILYKEGADGTAINVPVIASADAIEGTNDLKVSEGAAYSNAFVLAMNPTIGFYLWDDSVILEAGKIYLEGQTTLARQFIGFDEGATAINAVETSNVENKTFYNLAGQRVAQPTKGLYIVNGKKVIIK